MWNIGLSRISTYRAGYAGTGWGNRAPRVKELKRKNGRHFVDDIDIRIKTSLKYVRYGLINNKAALVQVMAWCRTEDKLLPETVMAQYTDAFMRPSGSVC